MLQGVALYLRVYDLGVLLDYWFLLDQQMETIPKMAFVHLCLVYQLQHLDMRNLPLWFMPP